MLIKISAILVFLAIIISLSSALFHLVKSPDGEQSAKILKALTIRIGLSVILFILLFIAYATGMFQPEGIGARIQQHSSTQPDNQQR